MPCSGTLGQRGNWLAGQVIKALDGGAAVSLPFDPDD
jgi:hypothetical protein